jgi:hypothetical protein
MRTKIPKLVLSIALVVSFMHRATSVQAGVAVRIGQNFTGSTDSLAWAPSPSGAANTDYFVEFNVDTFAVYRKADGTVVQSLPWDSFWSQAGVTIPSTYGRNMARVVYDPTVQRWFVAEDVGDQNNPTTTYHFLLAVSATADPTGVWNGVSIAGDPGGNTGASWVTMGLDAQGVYLSARVFPATGGRTVGSTLLSLPKTDLLAIPPVITNRTWFGALSASTYGYGLQPAVCLDGSAGGNILATAGRGAPGDNNNTLFAFAVQNAAGPGPATVTSPSSSSVPDYSGPFPNALQPDGSSNLFTPNALFSASSFRTSTNIFVTGDSLVGGRNAIRWYRLSAVTYALLEWGILSDPSLDLYYPSIAANTNGTVVIAYNGSGTNTFVSCFIRVGQLVNGVTTFGPPLLLQSGLASYQNLDYNGDNLWGAYSTASVDPTDPNVFWTINAYAVGPTTWATQITQLLTSHSPRLSISNAGANVLLSWPVTAVPFQVETGPNLAGTNSWSSVIPAVTTNGNTVSVLTPATNRSAFFRLVQSQ